METGFENREQFKNWNKKAFLGLSDFRFLQGFTAWNLVLNIPDIPRRGGQKKFRELKNWEFYSIASEEMMIYVDNDENQNFKRVKTETHMHTTTPVPKNCHTNIPTCMICSM